MNRESYLLTNTVPQLHELNLSQWRKIENQIQRLATQSDSVFIITGTLFDCDNLQHIGPNRIAVPCATYKAAFARQGDTRVTFAVILDNQPATAPETVSLAQLESRTGPIHLPHPPAPYRAATVRESARRQAAGTALRTGLHTPPD